MPTIGLLSAIEPVEPQKGGPPRWEVEDPAVGGHQVVAVPLGVAAMPDDRLVEGMDPVEP